MHDIIDADFRSLVSSSDIVYHVPTGDSIEGQPIGNGCMGTLVWTTPGALHFQVNRSDVFAVDGSHLGAQYGPADCCGTCAQVTIEVGGEPFAPSEMFEHRLSLYDAETFIRGAGVTARCFVASDRDMLVVELDDRRPSPPPFRVTLAMWRAPEVLTGGHVARLWFEQPDGRLLLRQRFEEGEYRCASAVGAQIAGHPATLEGAEERTRTLVSLDRAGRTVVLIAAAADRSRGDEAAGTALRLLETAAALTFESLRRRHLRWWHQFWSRTFVQLASSDGLAEFMDRLRHLHLYCMAATSRGPLPPKFNGVLFTTEGDRRQWGAQFWLWNTELIYYPLFAADACDLTDPYFDMYSRMLPACRIAAKQRWGLEGAFYPETIPFSGPTELSDEAASEFQDVMLGRKPAWELSEGTLAECSYDSQLRATASTRERGKDHLQLGRYTWISHIVSGVLDLGLQSWWRFRYTGDRAWLRDHAYPMLRAGMEFYRSLARRGEDGRYHLYPTNVRERFWGVRDSIVDLAALRGAGPLAITASKLLGLDEHLRRKWQKLLDDLAPYPMGCEPEAQALTGGVLAQDAWAAGRLGDVPGSRNAEQVWLSPVFPFEDHTLQTEDSVTAGIAQRTFDLLPFRRDLRLGSTSVVWSRLPILAARMGRGEELPLILAGHYAGQPVLPNGLSTQEGEQAQAIEHLASIAAGLQDALVQSLSPRPGEPELLLLCPALPVGWEATFRLLVRGGFVVTAQRLDGAIRFVQIDSRRGEPCSIRNPWSEACVLVDADGCRRTLTGEVLRFDTRPRGRYLVYPTSLPEPKPEPLAAQAMKPDAFRFMLPCPPSEPDRSAGSVSVTLEGRIGKQLA